MPFVIFFVLFVILFRLNLLREDRCLAPANRLTTPEPVLMHDSEVSLRLILYLTWRMALEAEQHLEQNPNQARMNGQVQQMSARRNHARQLIYPFLERNILQRSSRHHQVERLIGKRQAQQISLRERHITLAPGAVIEGLPRRRN